MSAPFRSWLPAVSSTVLTIGWVSALVMWAYQAYKFAKHGAWGAISTNDVLLWFTGQYWFVQPNDWIGVHHALDWLNGGFAIGASATLLAIFIASLDNLK